MARPYPIDRLENSEIKKGLVATGVDENLIDDVLRQFWFQDYHNSFVSFPEYYEVLKQYLSQEKPKTFSRPVFYDFFYRTILGKNYDQVIPNLRKLALAFESAHTDRILVSKFSQAIKNLGGLDGFITLQSLVDLKLATIEEIKDITENSYFVWKHHTLTESLASEEILLNSDQSKYAASKMILEKDGVVAFKNSWYGTLRFLLEGDNGPIFSEFLLDLGTKYPDNIDDQYTETLLWPNPSRLSEGVRSSIFELLYGRYQTQRLWIPSWSRLKPFLT